MRQLKTPFCTEIRRVYAQGLAGIINQSNPEVFLMEKRIGTVLIEVESKEEVQLMNDIISKHSHIIIGRQGLPRNDRLSLISLVLEGTTDEIGSLTGRLGRLNGIQVKSVLLKNNKGNETEDEII